MLSYEQIKARATEHLALTGLTQSEFAALLIPFEQALLADQAERAARKKERQRQAGGGRKPKLLTGEDKLLFILFYFKTYPLQAVMGVIFGLSQGQANGWIHRLSPILQGALGQEACLPEREPHNLAQVLSEQDVLEFIIDGTERRRQRPLDKTQQRDCYSGKKRTHTHKNNLIVALVSRWVCYLSRTYAGRRHDKKICDEESYTFPKQSLLFKDTGFQGYEPDQVITYQPQKKPKGGALTLEQKFLNAVISSARITVENVISGVKRSRIVKDVFRNTKANFDDLVMEIACGLHNFRTKHRHLSPSFDLLAACA